VTRACPSCGRVGLPDESRFCLACGAGISPADGDRHTPVEPYTPDHLAREVFTTRTAQDGERKEVTILFVDIAGSLAMAEALDPEEIHAIMDGFFELGLDAVHAQRGTINQFRGDGFMALFGAPLAWGEDAAGGLRAALAIREATLDYSRSIEARFGIPIILRMGLHTGTVWVGSVGNDLRRDYTAEGPTVGLAARLEQSASPGQILLTEETERRARLFFEFTDLGLRRYRGVSRPVQVFELTGRGPFRDRFDAERASGLSPFVGRAREVAWLEQLVVRPAEPIGVVEIRGEAGIGKSRLVHEYLSTRSAATVKLLAQSREGDSLRAYAPWLELLRQWPPELPGGEEATQLAGNFGGDLAQVSGNCEDFAERLVELLAKAVGERPVVLTIEDTHWIDPSSREALELLARKPSPGPLVLLTTARPDSGQEWSQQIGLQQLELRPLVPTAAKELAGTLLRDVDAAEPLITLAIERGGGNPLFLEEVARTLRDGGAEVRRTARLEMELRRSKNRVPETLNGVISARIDALPDPAKRLLQAASVIGRPFDLALMECIEPESEAPLETLLAELLQRGLLGRASDQSLEFRHVLVREVAYGQLLAARRRELHGRCAQALKELGLPSTPDGASLVGTHYDLGDMPSHAAKYLAAAGRAYLALSAPREGASHLQRAWQISRAEPESDPGALTNLGLLLVSALNSLDRAGEAAQVLNELSAEGAYPSDRQKLAGLCIGGGWVRFSEEGDAEEGRRLIERGLALAEQLPDGERLCMVALAHLARLNTLNGETSRALANADQLFERASFAKDSFFQAYALSLRGAALCDRGDVVAALAAARKGATLADQIQNDMAMALVYSLLAQAYVFLGEPEQALEAAERARIAGEKSRQIGAIYHAAAWGGQAYLLLGDKIRGVREVEKLAEINDSWPSTPHWRARGRVELGQYGEAAKLARECLERKPPRVLRARALCTLGLALGLDEPGDRDAAEEALFESIALCERLGLRLYLAEAKRALAEVCRRWGETERARRYAEEAAELMEASVGRAERIG
jgi:class 3 adenylate cyclase/tetratricopeptide (TPR) repeat protein